MTPTSRTIVHYALALIAVIVTAAILALALVTLYGRDEQALHERAESLHLRSLAQSVAVEREVAAARLQVASGNAGNLAAHWFAARRHLAELHAMHARYPDLLRDGVLSRARSQLADLESLPASDPALPARIDDLMLGLAQLSRLHSADAQATLDSIDAYHRRYQRAAWFATIPVMAIAALIVWHILRLMRATLTRQAQIEDALRASRERAHQLQKLEALSQLVGGVAHDFNNLLTAVTGNAQLLLLDSATPESVRRGLQQIDTAAQRAIDLTRQLRAFGRQHEGAPRDIDAAARLQKRRDSFAHIVGPQRVFDVDLQAPLPRVRIDPAQLDGAVAALLDNARAATAEGGRVTLRAEAFRSTAGRELHDMLGDGDFVRLIVEDDGVGMDEDTMSRAAEPFFSTREQGDGRGLGLSMVQGVVQAAGGYLHLDSRPGRGTRVEIYLPALAHAAVGQTASVGGSETVLVVDDEPAICELLHQGLGGLGYRVLTAAGAEQALEVCSARGAELEALVTDIVMPGDSGLELARKAQDRLPSLAIVLMSGFAERVFDANDVVEPRYPLIDKPFTIDEVARVLRQELDARTAA